jgi:ATP-dependent DNA helicase PIF1
MEYIAKDGGSAQNPERLAKLLGHFRAVGHLILRIDAPVMLIKNVDANLVNGSMGKVIAFRDPTSYTTETGASQLGDGVGSGTLYPEVQFKSGSSTITRLIFPESWKTMLPDGEVEASRKQVEISCNLFNGLQQNLATPGFSLGNVYS